MVTCMAVRSRDTLFYPLNEQRNDSGKAANKWKIFSVTPFKIDQSKSQNRSID